LNANENKNLSTTQINLGKEDEVIVLLLFYDENKNLLKDRVVLVLKKKVKIVPIDGFELRELFHETKTKMVKIFMICIIIYIMTIKLMKEIVVIIEEFSFPEIKKNNKHKQQSSL
jgi:hypothetical protein